MPPMQLTLNQRRLPQRSAGSRFSGMAQQSQQGAPGPTTGPLQFQAPAQRRLMPGVAPGAGVTSPTAPPANPRAGINNMYQQMLDENKTARSDVEAMGMRNINALLRRNASLAAMSGQGIGGGYLSGQRTALTTGMQGLQSGLMQNDAARRDILMRQLGDQLADTRRDEDWKRQDTKDAAAAEQEKNKQLRQSEADRLMGAFKSAIGNPNDPQHAWFVQQVQNYVTTGDPAILNYLNQYIAQRPKTSKFDMREQAIRETKEKNAGTWGGYYNQMKYGS
jgi:hypothetical protein